MASIEVLLKQGEVSHFGTTMGPAMMRSGLRTLCPPWLKSLSHPRGLAVYKSPVKVDFYYDTISPYSWLAFEILLRYQPVWNLDITLKPVFIGGLSQATNNDFMKTLTKNRNKASYMFQDLAKMADYYKVPLRIPESPFYLLGVVGSLKQQRFLTATQMKVPALTEDLSRSLWYRGWAEDLDVAKPGSLRMVGRRAGLSEEEVEDIMVASESQEVKDRLREVTHEAVEEGACGLPFFVFRVRRGEDEVDTYFGCDRFPLMAHRLGLEWKGPVPIVEEFEALEDPPEIAKCFLSNEQYDEINDHFVKNVHQEFGEPPKRGADGPS